tara:strand:- start:4903 stop:5760 length:858 start_codon:yes stop_codon:yes gene_type:complete
MKILLTGTNGQLGSEIKKKSGSFSFQWVFSDYDTFDLSQLHQIPQKLNQIKPDLIINCGAYTNVEYAEIEYDKANEINNLAVGVISKWVCKNDSKLIHISTDYVFDGTSNTPIKEVDKAKPINKYGLTKLNGELACLQNDPNSIIIRTSWVYSSFGNNFVKTMIKLMKEQKCIDVVCDQVGTPTYASDLADVIMQIINHNHWVPGIYNYSNEGEISWYDFALYIREICDFKVKINPVMSNQFNSKAKRPKYSLLNKTKIKKTYGLKIPYFKDSVKKCISILMNEK